MPINRVALRHREQPSFYTMSRQTLSAESIWSTIRNFNRSYKTCERLYRLGRLKPMIPFPAKTSSLQTDLIG
jgi:hypothetical protein